MGNHGPSRMLGDIFLEDNFAKCIIGLHRTPFDKTALLLGTDTKEIIREGTKTVLFRLCTKENYTNGRLFLFFWS